MVTAERAPGQDELPAGPAWEPPVGTVSPGGVSPGRVTPGGVSRGASSSAEGPSEPGGGRGGLRRALTAVSAPFRWLVHWWRRSIQVRVVIGVLALSAMLAALAGWLLLHQVTDGLVQTKQQTALTQAAAGLSEARARLDSEDLTPTSDLGANMNELIDQLAPRDQAANDFSVLVIGPLASVRPDAPITWGPRNSGQYDVATSIPQALVARVKTETGTWYAYSSIHHAGDQSGQAAIVVGSKVIVTTDQSVTYGVFYVFPLDEQQQTLSVLERGLIAAGLVLVVLLSTIAWLVTRQVVTPVRLARRIAERLADGRLEERMHVRGEDDIARLGQSFNKMASGLQRQIRQLEELSRVQQRFVADVSHELRTPLTTVRMASDLLYEARDEFDAPTSRSAELLQHELGRFESLLTDLLEISRFDAGAAALELGEIDLNDLARRVVDASTVLASQRGSALRLSVPAEPSVVQADVRRVERIVRNLVGNAIQYGKGRDVEVSVERGQDHVSVLVRDHGVGLRPGEEKLVFNRFWRADPARTRTRGGTGLGLSIAMEDTVLHGGRLEARGRAGRGSVFRLTLPLHVDGSMQLEALRLDPVAPVAVGGPYARLSKDPERDR